MWQRCKPREACDVTRSWVCLTSDNTRPLKKGLRLTACRVLLADASVVTPFFDRFLFGFGPFDLTTCSQALIAKHPHSFDFRFLAAA